MQFHLVAFTFFPLYSSTLFPNNSLACVYRSSSRRMLVVCFCFSCCLFNIPEVSPHSSAKHGTPSRCSPAPALRWLYVFNLLSPYHVRSGRQRCFAGIALSFLVFEDGLGISQLTLCAAELLDEMYRCVHMEKSFLALWWENLFAELSRNSCFLPSTARAPLYPSGGQYAYAMECFKWR